MNINKQEGINGLRMNNHQLSEIRTSTAWSILSEKVTVILGFFVIIEVGLYPSYVDFLDYSKEIVTNYMMNATFDMIRVLLFKISE